MKHLTIFLYVSVFLFFSEDVHGARIPDYVIKCSRSAPVGLDDPCVRGNVDILRPKFAQGIPELHIPPMEPLFVESIALSSPNFHAEFTNCSVVGGTNFDLLNMTFNYQKLMISLHARFNSIRVDGSYHISGRLLMLQLENQGTGYFGGDNIGAFVEMHAKFRVNHGKKYLDFHDGSQQKIKLTFNEKPVLLFKNLFPRNEELTRITNAAVNDNIMDFFTDIMPVLNEGIGTFVFNSVLPTFDSFSVDELYLP